MATEERVIVKADASVLKFDDEAKKWVFSGDNKGFSNVRLYKHTGNLMYRVVARNHQTKEVCINSMFSKKTVYQVTKTFHQWRDRVGNKAVVYGLQFLNEEDGDRFGKATDAAIAELKALAADPAAAKIAMAPPRTSSFGAGSAPSSTDGPAEPTKPSRSASSPPQAAHSPQQAPQPEKTISPQPAARRPTMPREPSSAPPTGAPPAPPSLGAPPAPPSLGAPPAPPSLGAPAAPPPEAPPAPTAPAAPPPPASGPANSPAPAPPPPPMGGSPSASPAVSLADQIKATKLSAAKQREDSPKAPAAPAAPSFHEEMARKLRERKSASDGPDPALVVPSPATLRKAPPPVVKKKAAVKAPAAEPAPKATAPEPEKAPSPLAVVENKLPAIEPEAPFAAAPAAAVPSAASPPRAAPQIDWVDFKSSMMSDLSAQLEDFTKQMLSAFEKRIDEHIAKQTSSA